MTFSLYIEPKTIPEVLMRKTQMYNRKIYQAVHHTLNQPETSILDPQRNDYIKPPRLVAKLLKTRMVPIVQKKQTG